MAATIAEIATLAGVSHSTVSRLVRNDPKLRISAIRRKAILDIIDRQGGCEPHRTGRALMSRRAEVLLWPICREQEGSVLQMSHVSTAMMQGAEDYARRKGYRLTVVFFVESNKHEELPSLCQSRDFADGALFGWGVIDNGLARQLNQMRYPHVCFDWDMRRQCMSIPLLADEAVGIKQAVQHLARSGASPHRIILAVHVDSAPLPCVLWRQRRIWVCPSTRDRVVLGKLDTTRITWESDCCDLGKAQMLHMLDTTDCTAVFCETDGFAFGAVDALRQRGLQPGRDMSIVGYDDIENKGWRPFDEPCILTTVHNPLETRSAARAAQCLMEQVEKGVAMSRGWRRIDTSLVIRSTTGPVK